MDYGPAIAAAFASQQPQEIHQFRRMLSECIRKAQNHPLQQPPNYTQYPSPPSNSMNAHAPTTNRPVFQYEDAQEALGVTRNVSSAATVTGVEGSASSVVLSRSNPAPANVHHGYAADDTYGKLVIHIVTYN